MQGAVWCAGGSVACKRQCGVQAAVWRTSGSVAGEGGKTGEYLSVILLRRSSTRSMCVRACVRACVLDILPAKHNVRARGTFLL